MKKILSLLLMMMFVVALAACDGTTTELTSTEVPTTTEQETDEPTQAPTEEPTTVEPTEAPTEEPTEAPTEEPTTIEPTEAPTEEPTTVQPTEEPTEEPTEVPTTVEPTTEEPTTEEPTTPADTTPPVISGVSNVEIFLNTEFDPLEGVTAIDNVDGDITDQIQVLSTGLLENGMIDTSKTGTIFVKYRVEDSAGLITEKTIYITIVIDPSTIGDDFIQNGDFSLGAGIWSVALNEGGDGEFTVVEEGDNLVGAVIIRAAGWSPPFPRLDSNVAEFENGVTYEVVFKAKADLPRPIKVQVGQLLPSAPWFVDYKPLQTEIFDLTTEWQTFSFKFTMGQDAEIGALLEGQLLFEHGGTIEGEVAVPAANYATTVYYDDVTIEVTTADPDETAPVLTGVKDSTIEKGSTFDPLAGVSALDVVDGVITLTEANYISDVDTSVAGTYTVTYTVSDAAGNEVTATRTITVVELIFNPSTEVVDGTFTTTTEIIAEVQDENNNYADITDPEIWYHYVADWDGAAASASIVDGAAQFNITASGNNTWGVMLKQRGIALVQGETYKVSFTASSNVDRDIMVTLGAIYTETFNLTSTPTTFSFMFTYEGANTIDAKLEFLLGKTTNFAASLVTIDDVELSVLQQNDLVVNDNFNNIGWSTWAQDWGAVGGIDIQVINGELVADVTSVSEAFWSVQLFQEGIVLVPGTEYTITFDAKASVARDMNLVLIDANAVEFRQVFNLTTDMETYTFTFTYDGTATSGKIDFELGNISEASVPAVVTFDNITMSDGTDPVTVVNGDFEQVIGWSTWAQDWGAVGTVDISVVNGQLLVDVAAISEAFWSIQLFQEGIELVEGASYTIIFNASASVARDMNAVLIDANNVEFRQVFNLTTEMATYAYTFTYNGAATLGKLDFELGNISEASVPAVITFENINMFRNYNVVAEDPEDPEEPVEDVLESWTAYGDYSLVNVLTYGAVPEAWWNSNLQGAFAGFDPTNTTFDITFIGEAGQTYLFKVEGGGQDAEQLITADGNQQTVSIDLSAMTEEQRAGLNLMVIFAQTLNATGTLKIMPITDLEVEWIAYGDMSLAYEVTYGAVATEWWNSNFQGVISNFDEAATSIEFTFIGELDQVYLIKIENTTTKAFYEIPVTATGVEQVVTLDLSGLAEADRAGLDLFIIFAQTVGETGTFSVLGWEAIGAVTPEWVAYNAISVEETEAGALITYDAVPATVWDNNVQSTIADFDGTKTSLVFTVTGVAGHEYLIKVEGGGKFAETRFFASGASEEVVISVAALSEAERAGLNLIVVFVTASDAAGTLLIEGWAYGEEVIVVPAWAGYGNFTVTENETNVEIVYGTTATNWWENNAQALLENFDGTKSSIIFTFTGVLDHEYVFKVEGDLALEVSAIGTGAEQSVELSLSTMTEAQRNTIDLLIIFSKTVGAEGTMIFNGWTYGEASSVQQLITPFGMVINESGILQWGALPEASSFEVYINGATDPAYTTLAGDYDFDLAALGLSAGTYDIQLKAIGNGTTYTDSELSAAITYTVE
ncbi:DUF5011 domain-containing protein [Hujiaoplasma nucleasis]|uniref:DUF5011 domain-containing protein n=1 Tax=Hujiaoplasma nucleasis TaxID=2725268 RepID=A0A7L6MZX4_9MOLU|nr:carbohydrate binding domain-containing protein [Hujiaoplasma nucleasis]QLY39533.1 DUF5011 domain-containing protein [Hujiaoplasma nucleasis]